MKTIKVLKVVTVEREIPLLEFLNSREAYFEFIDKDIDDCYIPDSYYPNDSFIMIYQELDSGEISMHEIGYVLCSIGGEFSDSELKEYVIEHIDEFVSLDL